MAGHAGVREEPAERDSRPRDRGRPGRGIAPRARSHHPHARWAAPHPLRARADTLSVRIAAAAPPPGPHIPGRPPTPARAPASSSHGRAAPPKAANETRRSRALPAAVMAGSLVSAGCDAGRPAVAARGSPSADGPPPVGCGEGPGDRDPGRPARGSTPSGWPINPAAPTRSPAPCRSHASRTGWGF